MPLEHLRNLNDYRGRISRAASRNASVDRALGRTSAHAPSLAAHRGGVSTPNAMLALAYGLLLCSSLVHARGLPPPRTASKLRDAPFEPHHHSGLQRLSATEDCIGSRGANARSDGPPCQPAISAARDDAPRRSRSRRTAGAVQTDKPISDCSRPSRSPLETRLEVDSDGRFLLQAAKRACEHEAIDRVHCLAHRLQLERLLDDARWLPRSEVVAMVRYVPTMTDLADEMIKQLRSAAGAEPAPVLEVAERVESLADQLIAHSWGRFLTHTFLNQSGAAERYKDPLPALQALLQWADCEDAACILARVPLDDRQNRLVYAAALLNQLARTGSLYRSDRMEGIGIDDTTFATVPLNDWPALYAQIYRHPTRYADKALTLVENPYPQSMGERVIRFDGTCYHGATGLSYRADDRAELQQALNYHVGPACERFDPSKEPVDLDHRIGTLAHSLTSVLKLLAPADVSTVRLQDNGARVERLLAAIRTHRRHPSGYAIHPGWLAALHLAYSSGLEPLSMPQLHRWWRETIYREVKGLLVWDVASPQTRSDWLDAALCELPPLRESQSDHALEQWITFLRDDVPRRLAFLERAPDDKRDEAEIAILRKWCVAGDRRSLQFYATASEHFDIVGSYFYERLQALLPLNGSRPWQANDEQVLRDLARWSVDTRWSGAPLALASTAGDDSREQSQRAAERSGQAPAMHHGLLARARENLREAGGKFDDAAQVVEHARSLADRHDKATPPGSFETTGRVLLGLLPIVGSLPSLYDDYEHGDVAGALIDGSFLLLSVADMYGAAIAKCLPAEARAVFRSAGEVLADSEVRQIALSGLQTSARVKRAGAVYRELEDNSHHAIKPEVVVVHDAEHDRFQRIETNVLQKSPPPLAERYTVTAASEWLQKAPTVDVPEPPVRSKFEDLFIFDDRSPAALRPAVIAIFDEACERSPTFRQLLGAGRRDALKWIVTLRKDGRFHTFFAHDNAVDEHRIHLGTADDLSNVRYMSTRGLEPMNYRRAVIHELVHSLTGLRDTPLQAACSQQESRLRRMSAELDNATPPLPDGSDVFRLRRIEQGKRNLETARHALAAMYDEMAEERGPVVYYTDRIMQDLVDGSPERTMYLAGPMIDETRVAAMTRRRNSALARLHHENDYLDRLWAERLQITADTRLVGNVLLGDAPVVKAWFQLLQRNANYDRIAAGNRINTIPPRYTVSSLLQHSTDSILQMLTIRSTTLRVLMSEWTQPWRKSQPWTFVTDGPFRAGGGATAALDVGARKIDISTRRFIVTSTGMERITTLRAIVSGVVEMVLHDLNGPRPRPTGTAESRWLGTALEQRILDEARETTSLRLTGESYAEGERPADLDMTLSALRRAVLLENRMIEQLTPNAAY